MSMSDSLTLSMLSMWNIYVNLHVCLCLFFIYVCFCSENAKYDSHRFERISNIIKQFKLSCTKYQSQFQGMEVRNSQFNALIDMFTGNTYIMVVMTDKYANIPSSLLQLNIASAKKHFEKFIPENA